VAEFRRVHVRAPSVLAKSRSSAPPPTSIPRNKTFGALGEIASVSGAPAAGRPVSASRHDLPRSRLASTCGRVVALLSSTVA
jgi:hypothetical protein